MATAQIPLQPRDVLHAPDASPSALMFPVIADVDADGFQDVVVVEPGGPSSDVPGAGRGWLLRGPALGKPFVPFLSLDPVPGENLGWGGVAVGDANRDGYPDVLVGSPLWDNYETLNAGRAMLFLGPDLQRGLVLRNPDPQWHGRFGEGGLLVADVTGDGRADVVVGVPGAFLGRDAKVGAAWIWPGQHDSGGGFLGKPERLPNPYPLQSFSSTGTVFGRSFARRDALAPLGFEFFVGVHSNNGQGSGFGRVFGYHDTVAFPDWSLLPGALPGGGAVVIDFGTPMVAPPAGSSLEDSLVVSAPESRLKAFDCSEAGAVFIHDGQDYEHLALTLTSPDACTGTRRLFGEKVLAADLDRDGADELLISDPAVAVAPPGVFSRVVVYHGPDYVTWQPVGEEWKTEVVFGRWMDAGDIDNDGFPELVVGRTNDFGPGFLVVYDVQTLHADAGDLSVSAGGDVRLMLTLAPEQAGAAYLTLLGTSGSMPGMVVGTAWLRLNPDPVTMLGVKAVGSPFLDGFAGVLDAEARATMTLHAPAGLPPALVGRTLTLAALTLPGDGAQSAGSTAVEIELVP